MFGHPWCRATAEPMQTRQSPRTWSLLFSAPLRMLKDLSSSPPSSPLPLWKKSIIILVPKKSLPSELDHYRPVALTSIILKEPGNTSLITELSYLSYFYFLTHFGHWDIYSDSAFLRVRVTKVKQNTQPHIIIHSIFYSVAVQGQLLGLLPSPAYLIWPPLRLSDDVPERKGCLIRGCPHSCL